MRVSTRRKKNACPHFSKFLINVQKNIQKVSPKNDNLNKQELQVLKHFPCFEKETFKYPDANFPKKLTVFRPFNS